MAVASSVVADSRTSTGSGSNYLYGFFYQAWKEEMSTDEAEKLVVKAVSLAIVRDGANAGVVRTVVPRELYAAKNGGSDHFMLSTCQVQLDEVCRLSSTVSSRGIGSARKEPWEERKRSLHHVLLPEKLSIRFFDVDSRSF
ncbi:hypothetical protein HPP92_021991 [Vanilla planifolia]|uniref:Uncharacterized protein n=1 Tax=Vanilla planifolia TaxID=51239 RepID=A0A835UG16_VANPL|nr:hypothetical protein HPP92_021991 [Vanilla planifolia]